MDFDTNKYKVWTLEKSFDVTLDDKPWTCIQ